MLRKRGDFAEALKAYKRGHELGSKHKDWSYPSADWMRETERLAALESRLPDLLEGKAKPKDAAEQADYAQLCSAKKLHARAVSLYVDAFTKDPKLADGVHDGNRYAAACDAALAGCGRGKDAPTDEAKRARLRARALAWLREHLEFTSKHLDEGTPKAKARTDVQRWLRHWQTDPDLACVRESAALDKLPEPEQKEWHQLWADVAKVLELAQTEK